MHLSWGRDGFFLWIFTAMVTIQSINLRAQSWLRARNTGWCQHANLWSLGGSQEWCKSQAADSVWKFFFLIVPPGSLRQTAAWLESPSGTHPSLPLWHSAFFRGFSRLFYVHVKEAFYCEVVGSHKTALWEHTAHKKKMQYLFGWMWI